MNANKIVIKVDEELRDIIPGFLERRKNEVPVLFKALDAKDFDFLETVGHRLKGSAGGYGFSQLGVIGSAIEIDAKEKNSEGIEFHLNELQVYLDKVEVVYEKQY